MFSGGLIMKIRHLKRISFGIYIKYFILNITSIFKDMASLEAVKATYMKGGFRTSMLTLVNQLFERTKDTEIRAFNSPHLLPIRVPRKRNKPWMRIKHKHQNYTA
jgi:acyl-CoA thioesterase